MRLRKLALAVGLAGAMSAEMASALGLGEIKLNSSLNEPLDAEIKLLQTRDLDESEILVALAGKQEFENAGVDRTFFLNDLKFKVHVNGSSGSVIRVTSSKPVREPYLNFLLQTQWPNGRILREYTLLMDLPVFSQETAKPVIRKQATTPKPVAQPRQQSARPSSQSSPRPSSTPAEAQAKAPKKPMSSDNTPSSSAPAATTYGPVKSSDTLWEIALKVRPGRSISVHKTMLAIQRLNPEAFINGNINLLRKGQVLRVPDSQQINELSRQEAVAQVATQNREWSDSKASTTGPQLDASTRFDGDRPKSSKVEGRLTLAAANKVEAARDGQLGSGGSDSGTESLQNELAISLEELDKSKRENAELNDRIRELEDQIGTMERLIEVSNQELRALQLANKVRSGEISEAEADALAKQDAMTKEDAIAKQDAIARQSAVQDLPESELANGGTESLANSDADTAVAAPARQSAANEKPAQSSTKTTSAATPKKGLMDTLMENLALIGGGAAAILLAVLLLARRRKPEEETTLEGYDDDLETSEETPSDDFVEETASDFIDDEEIADDEEIDDDILEDEDFNSESETGDAVAEADIYIAYGKFDQAEEMLLKAINSDDNARDARLKLLEVYAESDNLSSFDQQYAAVLATGDEDAVARAEELREQFAEAPAFDPDSVDAGDIETGDSDIAEFDLDLDGDNGLAGDDQDDQSDVAFELEGLDESFESDSNDDGFDFDLDLESDTDDTAADDGLSLDLDTDSEFDGEGLDLDLDLDLESELEDTAELDESATDFALDVEGLDVEGLNELDSSESIDLEIDEQSDIAFESEDITESSELDSLSEELSEMESSDAADATEFDNELALEDGEGFQTFDMDETTLEPDVPEDSDEDDFDISGDFEGDLAALDEEMEELSADLEVSELESGTTEDMTVSAVSETVDTESEGFDIAAEDIDAADAETVSLDENFALDDAPVLEEPQDLETEVSFENVEENLDVEEAGELDDQQLAAEQEPEASAMDTDLSLEDEVFSEALSDVPDADDAEVAQELQDVAPQTAADLDEDSLDDELDFLSDTDEVATKLDLARAYIDMGDHDGAKDILDEVVQEGTDEQKSEAEELLSKV